MNKTLLESYKELVSEFEKSENHILEETLNNSLTINELKDVLKQYLSKISLLETNFEKSKKENNKNLKKIEAATSEIKKIELNLDKKIEKVNGLIFGILVAFFISLIGLFYDIFFRFSEIKTNYINQTKELEKQIELFQKEVENLKEDNRKLKESIKNEVEKEIYKTILQKN